MRALASPKNYSALTFRDKAAVGRREHRRSPRLAERLLNAKPDELIEVAIWLNEPAYQAPARPAARSDISGAKSEEIFAQVDAQFSAFVKTGARRHN